MVNPLEIGDEGTSYNHIPLASCMGNIVQPYHPFMEPPQDTTEWIGTPTDPGSISESYKEIFEKIQMALIEEDFTRIGKYLDDALEEKAERDENLKMILISAIPQIFTYLNKVGKRYRLQAKIWTDIEVEDWEENVITIEVEYENREEKMKIWKEVCDTVYEIDPDVTFLIKIRRLK